MPAIIERLRQLRRTFQTRPRPLARRRAIALLERTGTLSPGEAHALRAGEHLADLYADVLSDGVGVGAQQVEEIEALICAGDLAEAVIQLGRLHPAFRDLPHLFNRSAPRARA